MEEENLEFPKLARLGKGYRSFALIVFNILFLFVACNLISLVMVGIYNQFFSPQPGALSYGLEDLRIVYPDMTDEEITELLEETWSREYIYEPYVQHREPVLNGTYITIDRAGYRLIANQGPWPIDQSATNIFVFGGSTAFGYGLPDEQTIPSYLQERLGEMDCQEIIYVYNFGSSNYFSVQERILFEQLVADGQVPDIAVFLDGLNEWNDAKYTDRLSYLMNETEGQLFVRAIKELPIVELARVFRDQLAPLNGESVDPDTIDELAGQTISRWTVNKRMIEATADDFDVQSVFVWQPVPYYKYDVNAHPFIESEADGVESSPGFARLPTGYELLLSEIGRSDGTGEFENLLWLADIQEGRNDPLYVDAVHYTAAFSEEIAGHIADFLVKESLVCGSE